MKVSKLHVGAASPFCIAVILMHPLPSYVVSEFDFGTAYEYPPSGREILHGTESRLGASSPMQRF